jgi:carboxymethylenebutenolidase
MTFRETRAMPDDVKMVMPDLSLSRRGFVVSSTFAAGFALAAQPISAQTVIQTDTAGLDAGTVEIPTKDIKMAGYRAMPASGGPFPVVLVVQEIFGVHEHIKDVCRRFGKAGFMAVAPELYQRQGDVSKLANFDQIRPIVAAVPDSQVMADLGAAAAWAKSTGKGNTDKLSVTGFCWGGRIVWLYAAHNPSLKAGVAWYGRVVGDATANQPKNPIDLVADIKAPVLGLYGGADQGIPNDTVERSKEAMTKAGKKFHIELYPDTPHGFHADYRPSYRKAQADDGWKRLLDWFKANGAA